MSIRNHSNISTIVTMVAMLSLTGGFAFAAEHAPLTPEYAAKRENFRKQHEQRITADKRKAAADALKAERMRVYQAKQSVRHSKPEKIDNK